MEHSDPEIRCRHAVEREVDLADVQENDQELEGGHGKRFSRDRERDEELKG